MGRKLSLAVGLALVLAVAAPVHAEGLYLGVGIQNISFGSDNDKYADYDNVIAVTGNLGIQFKPSYALEIVAGYGEPEENSSLIGTTGEYTWIEVGPKFIFYSDTNVRPSVTFGVGSYNLDMKTIEYKGTGGFVGFGIEEVAGGKHSVGLFVRGNYWLDDDLSWDVSSFSVTLNYALHF